MNEDTVSVLNMFGTECIDKEHAKEYIYSCVGEGWESLLDEIFEAVGDTPIVIHQVKEKFGGLRFYYSFSMTEGPIFEDEMDKIENVIEEIEEKSYTVCEYCGSSGSLRNDLSWIKTLCDKCYEETKSKYGAPYESRDLPL